MKRQALWIGAFVIGALLLAAGLVIWLSAGDLFNKKTRAVVYFQDGVAGLAKGSLVTFRGVPVGQVESVGLEVDPRTLGTRIPANLLLSSGTVTFRGGKDASTDAPDVAFLVRHGLRAQLVSQSLVTGQKSIELSMIANAPLGPVETGKRPEIPVVANRLDSLMAQLADTPVRETVDDMRKTLAELRTAIATASKTLASAQGTLDTTSREVVKMSAQARSTLVTAEQAIDQVQQSTLLTMTSVTRLANTANDTVEASKPELLRTLGSAREAADSARTATSHLSDLTAPDTPLRADLEGAVADLSQAARGLRDWSELLQEQPNAVIFGRKRP